ncbi:MAG: FMN-dependent NADH-azoreductase [Litorivicinus sp.]
MNVLVINSSARTQTSSSRQITQQVADSLSAKSATIHERDLSQGMPFVTEDWVMAGFTDPSEWTEGMQEARTTSDRLIAELKSADTLVIGAPIYNFGVPAVLKAYFDQICRAGDTFSYTENGPVGLLEGKRAFIVISSGGVPVDSPVDFATPWLRQVLNFIGITDVQVISADQQMTAEGRVDTALEAARAIA